MPPQRGRHDPAQDEGAHGEENAPQCKALVITCSDYRFKSAEREFATAAGLADDYDLIALPGGIRSVVVPKTAGHRSTLDDAIQSLWGVHRFPRIIAVAHLSCRAYDDIATAENERELHTDHLRRAREYLGSRFSGTTADTFLAEITSRGIQIGAVD